MGVEQKKQSFQKYILAYWQMETGGECMLAMINAVYLRYGGAARRLMHQKTVHFFPLATQNLSFFNYFPGRICYTFITMASSVNYFTRQSEFLSLKQLARRVLLARLWGDRRDPEEDWLYQRRKTEVGRMNDGSSKLRHLQI